MCPPRKSETTRLLEVIIDLQAAQLEETINMTAAIARLTAAVSQVGSRIEDVASALRAHPAAQNEDDQLNALAASLEAASKELDDVVTSINQQGQPETPAAGGADAGGGTVPSGDPTPGAEAGGEGAPPASGDAPPAS